jgi:hypothetical protein
MVEEPQITVVRLTFRISSEQQDAFASIYEELLVPILRQCGLALVKMPQGTFVRLFVIAAPTDLDPIRQSLSRDAQWRKILTDLAIKFDHPMPDGLLFYVLELYQTPSRGGQPGPHISGQGAWRSYDATNGLRAVLSFPYSKTAKADCGSAPLAGG